MPFERQRGQQRNGSMVDIAACCAEVLAGLDEDVLEYIVGSAAPEGTLELEREDLEEMVVPSKFFTTI